MHDCQKACLLKICVNCNDLKDGSINFEKQFHSSPFMLFKLTLDIRAMFFEEIIGLPFTLA